MHQSLQRIQISVTKITDYSVHSQIFIQYYPSSKCSATAMQIGSDIYSAVLQCTEKPLKCICCM